MQWLKVNLKALMPVITLAFVVFILDLHMHYATFKWKYSLVHKKANNLTNKDY